jgi:hypothetical protein
VIPVTRRSPHLRSWIKHEFARELMNLADRPGAHHPRLTRGRTPFLRRIPHVTPTGPKLPVICEIRTICGDQICRCNPRLQFQNNESPGSLTYCPSLPRRLSPSQCLGWCCCTVHRPKPRFSNFRRLLSEMLLPLQLKRPRSAIRFRTSQ